MGNIDDNDKTLNDIDRLREQDDEILNDSNYEHPNLSGREKRKRKRSVRRTKKLFRAIDILFALAQNTCPYVNRDNIKTINTELDIVYDDTLPAVCKLDFYRVNNEEKQPAIILIHGGGFSAPNVAFGR